MSITIDIHALQTLPPSLINRDDTGAPKSAIFGGVPRQRVSSQSWKRAIRKDFENELEPGTVGFRTRRVAALIVKKIRELDPSFSEEDATKEVVALFKTLQIKLVDKKKTPEEIAAEEADDAVQTIAIPDNAYLFFLSPLQIENAAKYLIEHKGEKHKKAAVQNLINQDHSIDIAMFGRMVADDPNFNVDASVQVAHALGIHESAPEFDYFTAVDDVVEDDRESGAGMIGTVQMMSSTLYRFATINVDSLSENLGSKEMAVHAAQAFVNSFIKSMPTGKQNTFANNTLPELVYVAVRDTRSVSLVNAFEDPVEATNDKSRRLVGAERMAAEEAQIEELYGFVPKKAFVMGLGELQTPFENIAESVKLPELADKLAVALEELK